VAATVSQTGLIPPAELSHLLCKVTEKIAWELASPSDHAPDWSALEWAVARAVAAIHGVSPLLSHTLHWLGPSPWTEFLVQQRLHTATRHLRMQALLALIDQGAREAGIAALALKGAALHQIGLYVAGERPMADIDLLVRRCDIERTALLLTSLGFRESVVTWKERVFISVDGKVPGEFGENCENSLKIELHERICEKLPWRVTDATDLIFPSRPHAGLNDYPSNASLMLHLLLHAAGSMSSQSLRLLQLHDLALLSARMSSSDWAEVLAADSRDMDLWWAYPPLKLMLRYYMAKVPSESLAVLAAHCPKLLRRVSARQTLYDVSFSYLWIKAFPGMEWSRSLVDMLRYAASRVHPDANHIALREYFARTQAGGKRSRWSRLSQGRRILRWMSSRQSRPLTMQAVAAALSQST
jgi:hypothetical protein